jgi:hypothetical protein
VAKITSNNRGTDHREQVAHSASNNYSNTCYSHPYSFALCIKKVTAPPADGISDLAFSKTSDLLAATSWNNEVRANNRQKQKLHQITHTRVLLVFVICLRNFFSQENDN